MNQTVNQSLVSLAEDGELRASTEDIALGYGLKHKNALSLLRRHLPSIQQFGEVAFETRLNPTGSPTEYALLNERQAMLLVSMMRNTKKVLEFKVRLVAEFARMAAALQNRDMTMWERRLKFEMKDSRSFERARIGSHLMLDRKKEKPVLAAERLLIESEMQKPLFAH